MFLDPTGTINVTLPPGWALHPISSSLTTLVFVDWESPIDRQCFIHLVPTHIGAAKSNKDWEASVRRQLPNDVTRVEMHEGPVLLVEKPRREGHVDQRWAIVRGPRLDVMVEQLGVPLGSTLSTPVLTEILRTLDVPSNRSVAKHHKKSEWDAAMQIARKDYDSGKSEVAANHLAKARKIAKEFWLYSLSSRPIPEIPAVIDEAEATLALVEVTGSLIFLHQATLTLYRAQRSLLETKVKSTPVHLKRLKTLLKWAMQLHGKFDGGQPPDNPVSACVMRARLLLRETIRILDSDNFKIGGPWATLLVEDAMTAVLYAKQGVIRTVPEDLKKKFVAKGITDKELQLKEANEAVETIALGLLVQAGTALQVARTFTGIDASRPISANWLLASRRLVQLSPTAQNQQGLVLALNSHAAAFLALGDAPSLAEAEQLLAEAEAVLDGLGDNVELQSQVFLNQAWLQYLRRQFKGSLRIINRAIAAAKRSRAPRIEHAAHSLRAGFLSIAGRHDEAIEEARKALSTMDDVAVSTHHLNLAIALNGAGKTDAALAEVRTGLAVALSDELLGSDLLRLLFAAAALLESVDHVASLDATEAAEAVIDILRLRVGHAIDRVAFDDAEHHREVAATLVQRRIDAGDILGALATADRHRARSIVEAVRRPVDRVDMEGTSEDPVPPPTDASLSEQVAFVTSLARTTLARQGVPLPLGGYELSQEVYSSGRTTLLLHPSGEQLLIFVIRPGEPVLIDATTAEVPMVKIIALTDNLRVQLNIVIATRAKRGKMPPQSIMDLAAVLADDDALDEADIKLNQLLKQLHDALLSMVLPLVHDKEPLVVVPYRDLAVIPLSVLVAPDGRPLAEHHALSILPSLASLRVFTPPMRRVLRAVVVGDPVTSPGHGLSPLKGAAVEAENVDRMLKQAGFTTKLLLKEEATESAFRTNAHGARIVHLACHATLREPASTSPLFLTAAPPDDGMLLPAEIAELRLDNALVVLAACQSGLGRATADGLLGLGRAFVQAGARATVLALWRVGDNETAYLMQELYKGLLGTAPGLKGPLDVAAALRRAQLMTCKKVSKHPSSWGPWLVVGDGGWCLA